MWYVEVFVADATYHRGEPLTYSSPTSLESGRIVVVPLRQKPVMALVLSTVEKPNFAAKKVLEVPALPPIPDALLKLMLWMRDYYPAPFGLTAQLFLPGSLPRKPQQPERIETAIQNTGLPPLTSDQQKALADINAPGIHILHGETGSGKTRVYVELAKRSLKLGKSSIILTPEIGLTSQLARVFSAVFGDRVVLMHSGLTDTARRQTWQRVLEQREPLIIIGARSALFAPLAAVGLIIVDESHETAYKQDQAPYYHTTSVAAKLGALHNATVVLGSATPLITDYYVATAKDLPIIRMTQVAAGTVDDQPPVQIVDLKDRTKFGKSPYFSKPLIEAIKDNLQKKQQVLLFLNRRGTARVVFCEKCGWQATCPHCDLPLVYHGDSHSMRCHSCSYKAPALSSCPECKSADIVFRSIGTKAIAEEAGRLFSEARIMRFDTDNKKDERLEAHYDKVRSGEVDIIVGTQTLAKGLDLPKLGLVGVIIADTSLYFPDFSAQERTYQLLSQVLGRVGRGHSHGSAIVQTYSPDSPLIQSIIKKDWDTFYNKELDERRLFLFPPFCYLLKLTCKRASSQSAQKAADQFANKLRNQKYNIIVEGPSPSFHEKVQNKFAWQVIVKSKSRGQLTDIIKNLPSGWSHDIDPMNLL